MMEAKKMFVAQNSALGSAHGAGHGPTICRPTMAPRKASVGGSNGISLDTIRSIKWVHTNSILISYETSEGMKEIQIDSDASSLKWLVETLSQRLAGKINSAK